MAIIAVLASILFPVFARARAQARRASCASNLKQLGLAITQYTQDYDETMFSQLNNAGDTDEWVVSLQPYIKSRQMLYCPERTTTGCPTTIDPTGRCSGYAPNFGYFNNQDGLGIFDAPVDANPPATSPKVYKGKKLSVFAHPARTIMMGDTNDSAMYTLNGQYQTHDGSELSAIRHGGMYNFLYVDGHVKGLRMAAYNISSYTGNFAIMPEKLSDHEQFCYDVDVPTQRTTPVYVGVPCKDIPQYMKNAGHFQPWTGG